VKSPSAVLVVLVVLGGGGTALAAAGVSSVVLGDGDGATAKSAQEPLGRLSASPPAPGPRQTGGAFTAKGDPGSDGITLGADAPRHVARGGGAGGGRLPFTGLVAIPVIALGLALLGGGLVLRRRTARALA
jgi:hypothetical protein